MLDIITTRRTVDVLELHTLNERNKLSSDCVNASNGNVLKMDTYHIRTGYTSINNRWTLDKPITSLSTCNMEVLLCTESC